MRVKNFLWDNGNVPHLTLGHGIEPEEAEEVLAINPLIRKTKKGHYAAFGRTVVGRLLVIVFEDRGRGLVRVISGWDMNKSEHRYYQTHRKGTRRSA
jgi:uncharacterized DUF497 family protein